MKIQQCLERLTTGKWKAKAMKVHERLNSDVDILHYTFEMNVQRVSFCLLSSSSLDNSLLIFRL
jgi:hypothetical protein